jgi:uncharacterized protein (TIGR02145 family)
LINYLDPNQNPTADGAQSSLAGGKMKSTTGWNNANIVANNESGFTGLPGGYRYGIGAANTIGYSGFWWSSTGLVSNGAWSRSLNYSNSNVLRSPTTAQCGFSVRCVRD